MNNNDDIIKSSDTSSCYLDMNNVKKVLSESYYQDNTQIMHVPTDFIDKLSTDKLYEPNANDSNLQPFVNKLREFESFSNNLAKQTSETVEKINHRIGDLWLDAGNNFNNMRNARGKSNAPMDKWDGIGLGINLLAAFCGSMAAREEKKRLREEAEEKQRTIERERQKWINGKIMEITSKLEDINNDANKLYNLYKNMANSTVHYDYYDYRMENDLRYSSISLITCFKLYCRMIYIQQKYRHFINNMMEIADGQQTNLYNFDRTIEYYYRNEINKWPVILYGNNDYCTNNWSINVMRLYTVRSGEFPLLIVSYRIIKDPN